MDAAPLADEAAISYLVKVLASILRLVPPDKAAKGLPPCPAEARKFVDAAAARGIALTAGLWAHQLRGAVGGWSNRAVRGDMLGLARLAADFPVAAQDDAYAALVVRCMTAMVELARFQDAAPGGTDSVALVRAVLELAASVGRLGRLDRGYDAAIAAIVLAPPAGPVTEEAARTALSIAVASGAAEQQATCHAILARAIVLAADEAPARRLEAFDACEAAIERIMRVGAPIQAALAAGLHEAMLARDHLRLASAPLVFVLPDAAPYRAEVAAAGLGAWKDRVATGAVSPWLQDVRGYFANNPLWFTIDDARATLLPPRVNDLHAVADWTHWTIDHPAYRHVIPNHRSFLRERRFAANLLVLTHEMTHVLSFLGAIGKALCCLRAAAHYDELVLWQNLSDEPPGTPAALASRFAQEGVAPLEPGRTALLVRSEHGLELGLKARALQDTWTPWFEGLAVFAETAADPMHDADIVDPVNNALRNLVDIQAEDGKSYADTLREAIDGFQRQTGDALRSAGSRRLSRFVRAIEPHYRAGYLAVRAVVTRWRRTAGRPISGTAAFRVLLHATRFGTAAALPDLALPAERFTREASAAMAAWASRLARLTRGQLDMLIGLDGSAPPGAELRWEDGRPRLVSRGEQPVDAMAALRALLERALAGLSAPTDVGRVEGAGEELRHMLEHAAWTLRNQTAQAGFERNFDFLLKLANQTLCTGSLLPIGRCDARFFLNHEPGRDHGGLVTLLRTTEDHVDGGGSSMNLFGDILEGDSAQRLAAEIAREASPRIEVTRVIDLAGLLTREIGQSGLHLMAYRLGDWFELRGSTDGTQVLLDARPKLKRDLVTLVRARLYPNAQQAAERTLAECAEHGARRTLDWIERSPVWLAGGQPIDAAPWVERVRKLALQVLDAGGREALEARAARSLLQALWEDPGLAGTLTEHDFDTLTATASEHRADVIAALFATALGGTAAPVVPGVAARRHCPGQLLRRYGHGWDVRSAK